ncbi:kinase-like domain-containing protein [Rhizophagus irregularis DAOM 181602=DAOM 197198]|nr:kinase-like domain-containing protein [Rhizophagus irregularis DAOM 181602=DAOM 197198]
MNKVEENYTSSKLITSKIHNFGNLPEPRNATEEEQEAFHSKLYDFNIPNNVNDFNKSNEQNNSKSSKVITILEVMYFNYPYKKCTPENFHYTSIIMLTTP